MYTLSKTFGDFHFDEQANLVEKELRKPNSKFVDKTNIEDKIVLAKCEDQIKSFYKQADFIQISRKQIKDSFSTDNLIVQTINSIEELKRTLNLHSKRLREFFELTAPEVSKKVEDHENLAHMIVEKSKETLEKQFKIKDSCGADLPEVDYEQIQDLARTNLMIAGLIHTQETYLEKTMEKYCPNLTILAGSLIGAKLIAHVGSLRKLAFLPASTVQILGAEKALFRHLRSGARGPKYGYLFNHSFVQNSKHKGAIARKLAAKISLCAKIDFNKGDVIADKYLAGLKNEV